MTFSANSTFDSRMGCAAIASNSVGGSPHHVVAVVRRKRLFIANPSSQNRPISGEWAWI